MIVPLYAGVPGRSDNLIIQVSPVGTMQTSNDIRDRIRADSDRIAVEINRLFPGTSEILTASMLYMLANRYTGNGIPTIKSDLLNLTGNAIDLGDI